MKKYKVYGSRFSAEAGVFAERMEFDHGALKFYVGDDLRLVIAHGNWTSCRISNQGDVFARDETLDLLDEDAH